MNSQRWIMVAGLAMGSYGTAYAAKGGNSENGGGGKSTTPSATLHSDCDSSPCVTGQTVYFWGEGYDASQAQALVQIGPGMWSATAVADDGTVDFHWSHFRLPGDYTFQLYQNGKGNKLELKASLTVTVE